jgi:2-polyprenyl-6-hydroxyphenyl methylase/3-demethylubiquinone-9 3-methyltransferase
MPSDPTPSSSIDPAEIARFEALAAEWWNPTGNFAVLHKFNPVRLAYIRSEIGAHFGRDPQSRTPFAGLRLLDIGCGGGLLAEPMARLGAAVIAVDASPKNIGTAKVHAEAEGLAIDYRAGTAEALAGEGARFDIILNMEVIEHVADVTAFIGSCSSMLAPGGAMLVATINRTPKARALALFAAERILRWVPEGTHTYEKLVKPKELESALAGAGLDVKRRTGVAYDILGDRWQLTSNLDVNYMMLVVKVASENPAQTV